MCRARDPESILSTIPSVVSGITGMLIGTADDQQVYTQ